jgi:hypothetical protein
MARWLDLTDAIRDLTGIMGRPRPGEPLMPDKSARDILEAVRLNVPVQKMRFQHVAQVLAGDLGPQIQAGKLTVKIDVTRATCLVEVFTTGYSRIGWQLQGDAFRLCVVPDPQLANGTDAWDKIEAHARCYKEFFDFAPVRETIPGAGPDIPSPSGGPLTFRHFKPNFAHRYLRVPGITTEQVRQLGVHYAQHAITARAADGPAIS